MGTASCMMKEDIFLLLIATSEKPEVLPVFLVSIQAFCKVSPWLLCIVMAQESFREICSHVQNRYEPAVVGHMGTHRGIVLLLQYCTKVMQMLVEEIQ